MIRTSLFRSFVRSKELGLPQATTWRIVHEDPHLKSDKAQITQKLKPNDHRLCGNLVNWALEQSEADPHF